MSYFNLAHIVISGGKLQLRDNGKFVSRDVITPVLYDFPRFLLEMISLGYNIRLRKKPRMNTEDTLNIPTAIFKVKLLKCVTLTFKAKLTGAKLYAKFNSITLLDNFRFFLNEPWTALIDLLMLV
jgi:hypothetical protein